LPIYKINKIKRIKIKKKYNKLLLDIVNSKYFFFQSSFIREKIYMYMLPALMVFLFLYFNVKIIHNIENPMDAMDETLMKKSINEFRFKGIRSLQ